MDLLNSNHFTKSMKAWCIINVCFVVLIPVFAHDKVDIYINCGATTNEIDGRDHEWSPDRDYISSGKIANVSNPVADSPELGTLRYFPDGFEEKSCYDISVIQGTKYFVRSKFFYGNYDGKGSPPTVNLYINSNIWKKVLTTIDTIVSTDIIILSPRNYMSVCLIGDSPTSVAFISAIELHILEETMYPNVLENQILLLISREDIGSVSSQNIRYPDDDYDRIWQTGSQDSNCVKINTTRAISGTGEKEQPPESVLQTAATANLKTSNQLIHNLPLQTSSQGVQYRIIFYFAEITDLSRKDLREFNIFIDNDTDLYGSPINVQKLAGGPYISFELYRNPTFYGPVTIKLVQTPNSTLPPILNALEVYTVLNNLEPQTDELEGYNTHTHTHTMFTFSVLALRKIKNKFDLDESEGDPCLPYRFTWDWVECSKGKPHVISIILSNKGLNGSIPNEITQLKQLSKLDMANNKLSGTIPDLSALQNLQTIDLHNNSLTGVIPDSLGRLPKLQHLLLQDNNLSGPVPSSLKNNPPVDLNVDGNPCLLSACFNTSSNTIHSNKTSSSNKRTVVLATALPATFVLVALIFCILVWMKKDAIKGGVIGDPVSISWRKYQSAKPLRYEEIVEATQNFATCIGMGGFGTIYHGILKDGTEIAVKRLHTHLQDRNQSQFLNEIQVVSRVHHKNLVSLIGYCIDPRRFLLVFEYMSGGTLRDRLYGDNSQEPLTWKERLAIALNAAQGVEYLHIGCTPQIIHRDLKSSNILLSDDLQAKVADFGIAKLFSREGLSHSTTVVKGTAGYLDPEYFSTNRITDKADVYSFGVILLEIMCGRAPLDRLLPERTPTLVTWFSKAIQNGQLKEVADPNLGRRYKEQSMWKVAEIAHACLNMVSEDRPNMSNVVLELKEAIQLETFDNIASASDHDLDASFPALDPR